MQDDQTNAPINACRFCGQVLAYVPSGEDDRGELHCKCSDALRLQRTERAYETVDDICIKDAEKNGFDILNGERISKIKSLCASIINGSMESAVFNVSDSDTVKLSDKEGYVYVKRKKTLVMEAM